MNQTHNQHEIIICSAAFVQLFLAWMNKSRPYLERAEKELKKEDDIAQDALCVLLCQHCKDRFMDPQQRDQGQGGLGQSGDKDT